MQCTSSGRTVSRTKLICALFLFVFPSHFSASSHQFRKAQNILHVDIIIASAKKFLNNDLPHKTYINWDALSYSPCMSPQYHDNWRLGWQELSHVYYQNAPFSLRAQDCHDNWRISEASSIFHTNQLPIRCWLRITLPSTACRSCSVRTIKDRCENFSRAGDLLCHTPRVHARVASINDPLHRYQFCGFRRLSIARLSAEIKSSETDGLSLTNVVLLRIERKAPAVSVKKKDEQLLNLVWYEMSNSSEITLAWSTYFTTDVVQCILYSKIK